MIRIRKSGYPVRMLDAEFVKKYRILEADPDKWCAAAAHRRSPTAFAGCNHALELTHCCVGAFACGRDSSPPSLLCGGGGGGQANIARYLPGTRPARRVADWPNGEPPRRNGEIVALARL